MPNSFLNRVFHAGSFAPALIVGLVVLAIPVVLVVPATPASAAMCEGCVVVSAPTIGLNAAAQPGLQSVIDQPDGVAVYTSLTTAVAGGGGTVWLAGHRTTHGAVFNLVPSLMPGDAINLIDDSGVHQYAVSRLLIVTESSWQNEVNIYDSSRPRLILQTSHPDSRLRYLIEAFGDVAPTGTPTDGPAVPAAPPTAPPVKSTESVVVESPERPKFGSIKS